MTFIGVETTDHQVEDRSWYLGTEALPGFTVSGALDMSAFVEAAHYPDGYVRSGQPLGRISATGLYGPYDDAALDGRGVCAGLLFSSVKVPLGGADPGCAVLRSFTAVKPSKLPVALDAAGQADLPLIDFVPDAA